MKEKQGRILTFGLIAIIVVFLSLIFYKTKIASYVLGKPEVLYLATKKDWGGKELEEYFKKLAKTKGSIYAFDVLRAAKLPPNTDIHLLGHAVGDILYEKEGEKGMTYCTNDFRNACSHSIVVGLFVDYGQKALEKIINACRSAPGGKGAYTMCMHGLGHGILVWYDYDLVKTVATCKKTGSPQYEWREETECVGGAIMELIGGGFHDRDRWRQKRAKYFTSADPLAPCNTSTIPDRDKHMCYLYLTSNLIEPLADTIPYLTEEGIRKAFTQCERIPKDQVQNRDYCLGGVSKEFIVAIAGRDFRKVENLTDDQLRRWYEYCTYAFNRDSIESCVRHTVNTFYWGGENRPNISVRFCNLIEDVAGKEVCYRHFIGNVKFYATSPLSLEAACKLLPEAYRQSCNVE